MTHLKKYWIWYLVAAVVVTIAILAYFNWETVKGWFSSNGATEQEQVLDANGNPTGGVVYVDSSASRAKKSCRKVTCCKTPQNPAGITGWVGDCSYPIS